RRAGAHHRPCRRLPRRAALRHHQARRHAEKAARLLAHQRARLAAAHPARAGPAARLRRFPEKPLGADAERRGADRMNAQRAALALAVLVALAACGGKEERARAHLERSRVLFAAAEYDKAGIELRNVLQIDPRSADAYPLSAQIWEAKSEFQKAFASYARAVELAPGDLEAKARMGRYYLFGGARDKAEEIAAEILAADSSDPHGRALKAALLAEKDPEAAAREARA